MLPCVRSHTIHLKFMILFNMYIFILDTATIQCKIKIYKIENQAFVSSLKVKIFNILNMTLCI